MNIPSVLAATMLPALLGLAVAVPGGHSEPGHPWSAAGAATGLVPAVKSPHGTVGNRLSISVRVSRSWCASLHRPCSDKDIIVLAPGQTSPAGTDVDAFEVPSGKKYFVIYDELLGSDHKCVGPGWHKIDDTIVARIHRASC